MDNDRVDNYELRELIDALRPNGDDLAGSDFAALARRAESDPEVRRACRRSRRLDIAISDALTDVPIPVGSVRRLLAVLASAAPRGADHAGATVAFSNAGSNCSPAVDVPVERVAASERSPPEQYWGMPAALMTVAGLALVACLLWRPAPIELTPHEIYDRACLLADEEDAAEQPHDDLPAPANYPVSKALAVQPIGWRRIEPLLGRTDGVAYILRSGVARATLYVIDDVAGFDAPQFVALPDSPQRQPHQTQGRSMAVWRTGKLVYLLVVRGGVAEYRAFVTPAGQLARRAWRPTAAGA